MKLIINGKEVTLPTSLAEITLGQRIAFQEQYGNTLDEMAAFIDKMPDDHEKELEVLEFGLEKMFRTFAFFANTTPEALKESEFIDTIASAYYASVKVLFEDEAAQDLQHEFMWKDEFWYLASPELKHGDTMRFGELIDAKQIIKDMIELGKNRWEYLVPLCAIYLRRKDEAYDPSFTYEDSERREMMLELPMDIALQVCFFLNSTLSIYMNASRSSSPAELRSPESLARRILSASAGSTS